MARITSVSEVPITLGVTDKNLAVHPELRSVTFADIFGTLHTVHYHVDGPFTTPEDVVAAHEDGTLHAHKTHEEAIAFARDRGDRAFADRLEERAHLQQSQQPQPYGGGQ